MINIKHGGYKLLPTLCNYRNITSFISVTMTHHNVISILLRMFHSNNLWRDPDRIDTTGLISHYLDIIKLYLFYTILGDCWNIQSHLKSVLTLKTVELLVWAFYDRILKENGKVENSTF